MLSLFTLTVVVPVVQFSEFLETAACHLQLSRN